MQNDNSNAYLRVAITGASSGIGKMLALNFAREATHLYLAGRDKARLEECKAEVLKANPNVIALTTSFDVNNESACKAWCDEIFATRLDVLIVNAGIAMGEDESLARHLEICHTNVLGVANIALDGFMRFRGQEWRDGRKGQLVLLSSIASLLAMPNAPSYSASKVFVRYLGEALSVAQNEVCITTICPGVIRTPLTRYLNPMIPQISCEVASEKIYRAIKKGKEYYIFPQWLGFGARFYTILPRCIKRHLSLFNRFGKL